MTSSRATARPEPREPEDDQDLVRQYLGQIAATPLLTADEEVELAKRIEAGVYADTLLRQQDRAHDSAELEKVARDGQRAKDHMIRANLRLVVSTAKRYARHGLPFLDIVQEGNLGLIRAVEKFDYAKGYKFSTYATWWIRQAIERGLAEHSRTIRIPVHMVERLSRLGRAQWRCQIRLGREPSEQEVAEEARLTVDEVGKLRRLGRETVSLDTPVGEDSETSVGDLIADTEMLQATDIVEFENFAAQLRAVLDTLPAREAVIISMRYGLHNGRQHTLQQVADRLGLTHERVRQLEKQAMSRLRSPERREPLVGWAG